MTFEPNGFDLDVALEVSDLDGDPLTVTVDGSFWTGGERVEPVW